MVRQEGRRRFKRDSWKDKEKMNMERGRGEEGRRRGTEDINNST